MIQKRLTSDVRAALGLQRPLPLGACWVMWGNPHVMVRWNCTSDRLFLTYDEVSKLFR